MANRRSSDSRRTSAPSPSVAAGETAQPSAAGTSNAASARADAAESRQVRRGATAEKGTARSPGSTGQETAGRGPSTGRSPITVSADTRRAMIAESAYLRAERRGFGSGREEEDWLAAEKEVDALLSAGQGGPQ